MSSARQSNNAAVLSLSLKRCCTVPLALLSFHFAKRKTCSRIPGRPEAHRTGSELQTCRPSQSRVKRRDCCLKVWRFGELCRTGFYDNLTSPSVANSLSLREIFTESFAHHPGHSSFHTISYPQTVLPCPICRWLPRAGAPTSDPDNCPVIIGSCDTQPGDLPGRNRFWPLWLEGM